MATYRCLHFFLQPGLEQHHIEQLTRKLSFSLNDLHLRLVASELCYYVFLTGDEPLPPDFNDKIVWLIQKPFGSQKVLRTSVLPLTADNIVLEFADLLHDRMTECEYVQPLQMLRSAVKPEFFSEVDVIKGKRDALRKASAEYGLALDEYDVDFYYHLFAELAKRNPTDVELFDLAQSNRQVFYLINLQALLRSVPGFFSIEHCRHWFFKGRLIVDCIEEPSSLFDMVVDTQKDSNANNVIKFNDNSSAIHGYSVSSLVPSSAPNGLQYRINKNLRHILLTAETHNFPTGVCPFPGAATGTGGRIRDVQATGRGAFVIAGVAGYSFGSLNIPGYELPWEDPSMDYPRSLASPLDICIEASNGASDYGNKFGEPVICGFARSFGLRIPRFDCGRIEYLKPIMFTAGIGFVDESNLRKANPVKGMCVVKIGGPVYRIGVAGGSASSLQVQGSIQRESEVEYGAVQRGDPEMAQKLNRVVRSCAELKSANPIQSIHDQGAGGNANVIKELVDSAGAVISADAFELGDASITVKELWVAEYQESNAVLVNAEDMPSLQRICEREKCSCCKVGIVTDDDRVFHLRSFEERSDALHFPSSLTVESVLQRVLRLPSVASKRYLTNKVDRSVTGLIAQQQCVGPLHTPVADVGVIAISYFETVGAAVAVGEQPIKCMLNAEHGARMTVAEALTNLVFASISSLRDVKCSANWMWPAKLPGGGFRLLKACKAMCAVMRDLGIAVDGGKDSLSMAANVNGSIVRSPDTLVVTAYAPCPDITKTVTPDLKCPNGKGVILQVRFGSDFKHNYLGGSAVAQCFSQIGDSCPDLRNVTQFRNAFDVTQELIRDETIKAGHDVSDGGLMTCVLEMAFAGNCGLSLNLPYAGDWLDLLFNEESGIVIEVAESVVEVVLSLYAARAVPCCVIGWSIKAPDQGTNMINVDIREETVFHQSLAVCRSLWEETSYNLEKRQCNLACVESEKRYMENFVTGPSFSTWHLPEFEHVIPYPVKEKNINLAVIREEGSNGDRELAAAFHAAGFTVWDLCMQDLLHKNVKLDWFRGLAFPGGFSYADVFGSAKGDKNLVALQISKLYN
ncbi:unnamed protein product [Soboliphyme baturini]|uniref:phosphoribosylformylglycinamidine synthase n=1 Tax=Soboliphyme baturini TaxID=241478 RepID=A0A183IL39_9BILA|nr:unnamed protein product [Soboliphyme baturini]